MVFSISYEYYTKEAAGYHSDILYFMEIEHILWKLIMINEIELIE